MLEIPFKFRKVKCKHSGGPEYKLIRNYLFSKYAKFSEKLKFLTPWYAHIRTCDTHVRTRGTRTCAYQGVQNFSFSENFTYILNEWALTWQAYFRMNNSMSHSIFIHFMPQRFILYPLKTSENQRFSVVFRGYRKRPVAWNGLTL